MKVTDLKDDYYMYGNKGALWSNKAHIAKGGSSKTLCGGYMLATNWCRIEKVEEIGCPECLHKYKGEQPVG